MYKKTLYFPIIALLLFCNVADGIKTKKNKRPKAEEDFSTLQPNVIAYSTFGFNDVGSYDGFVPTSPDYANFLTGAGQESTTRLYAPAFPSAMDSTGFNGNFDASPLTEHSSGPGEETMGSSGMLQYQTSSMNFFNDPNFVAVDNQNNNVGSEDRNEDSRSDSNAPVYGTKINGRHRSKSPSLFNSTDFDIFSKNFSNPSNNKYFHIHNEEPAHDNRPAYSEPSVKYQNEHIKTNNYVPTHATQDAVEKSVPNIHNVINFPKVVDFTKYYPTELDTSKFPDYTTFENTQNAIPNFPGENSLTVNINNQKFMHPKPKNAFREQFNFENNEEASANSPVKQINPYAGQDYRNYYNVISHNKQNIENTKIKSDLKKKLKHKPWAVENDDNNFKNLKDSNSLKEYGYTTNFSNMNVRYGPNEFNRPTSSNQDEIVPASSNLVDLTHYQSSESDFTEFKKMPEFNNNEEYPMFSPYKENTKPTDYFNQFKNSFSTVPTTSSYWGNAFKAPDYSVFRDQANKPFYNENNIPKRPNTPKPSEYKQIEWSSNRRPHKSQPVRDWAKDYLDTRYKSEEDLLDLRNHDTSQPSYIPTFKTSSNAVESEKEYKKLIEKWRQSYLESKQKDFSLRDYDSYGTEIKPLHVPLPKPYPIEVPHPVIVPVPRPYPVRVPVSRPVAVPVIRELTVPIEKPVPYPVIKKVPYPVEKFVPVPVEKEVAVPVDRPYPVHIPYIRPVFHHTRPVHEDSEADHSENDEDDFLRRPELKKAAQYKKRPYSSRNRPRRPSRTVYQERLRRRWPERRRPSGQSYEYKRVAKHSSRYNFNDNDSETDDEDRVDYTYCRRIGKC